MQATIDPANDANLTPRDRKLLANAPYAQASIPLQYQRSMVEYHRKEAPGSIVIDTDNRYLYYVLADNKAIRYGVTVGEEALSWYGIAKVGRKEEWPTWTPTAEINNPPHQQSAATNPALRGPARSSQPPQMAAAEPRKTKKSVYIQPSSLIFQSQLVATSAESKPASGAQATDF